MSERLQDGGVGTGLLRQTRGTRARARGILGRLVLFFKGRDKGTVAITFLLSLLVFVPVVGVIVQYALLANARVAVNRSVAAGARSAMVCLPQDPALDATSGEAPVDRAIWMVLESISPASPNAVGDGQTVADALQTAGLTLPPGYAARYTFAQQASVITVQRIRPDGTLDPVGTPENYATMQAPRVHITVTYWFKLTVPMFNMLLGNADTVAGVNGRFVTITASEDVQLSDGREANGTQVSPLQGAGGS